MKIFWLIVGLLIVIAGAFFVVPSMRARQARDAARGAEKQAIEAKLAAEKQVALNTAASKQAETKVQPVTAAPTPATTPAPIPAAEKPEVIAAKQEPPPVTSKNEAPATEKKVEKKLEPAKGDDQTAADLQKTLSGEPVVPAPETTPKKAETPAAEATPKVDQFKWVVETDPPKLEKRPDGTQKVDDRFVIKGDGTKDSPYVVSWDQLVSIQEAFDPSQKKDKIPSRIHFIDDSYVKITGYICFPLYVPQPKELLAMMNQWDGCCIGVPPTAYDAIEVHLRRKVEEDMRFAVHGSIVGKFQVKPYVTGNWLVGLYLMTDAEFEPSQGGGN